tara:strand:- start:121 stop:861 length:741 start_codon:yes stop_codon:yes gene_type:complete
MNLISFFDSVEKSRGFVLIALIDPDKKTMQDLMRIVDNVNNSNFDAIFVGGSTLSESDFKKAIDLIKHNTNLKVIIFPSSHKHISNNADGILFTTLLNSTNRKYLIDEQLKSASSLIDSGIDVIPTGYLHIDGGFVSDIEKVTQDKPISIQEIDLIISYAHLSQLFGFKYIYLEAGSGAVNRIPEDIISTIKGRCNIDVIVGGGIVNKEDINAYKNSGVSVIVIGNMLESETNLDKIQYDTNVSFK